MATDRRFAWYLAALLIFAGALFAANEIFVNTSPSGMFDKTLFEAGACGCTVLSSSKDFAALADPDTYFETPEQLAARLKTSLEKGTERPLENIVREHSLEALAKTLSTIVNHAR
ncbi:glycosyltransferase [Patescibacteria group bacterium]|nr:glycosyltransferase [Patescibacteria group bacterium]